MSYDYLPECCDVADANGLQVYRRKRAEWTALLETDENSVFNQIQTMLWHSAVFNQVNESRRLAHESGGNSAAMNGMLAEFIDHGFVAIQALAIRKLLEPPAANPNRQVVSLRRLLNDLRRHRTLITREIYVGYDGLPYDYEPVRRRHDERIMKLARSSGKLVSSSIPTTGPEGFRSSQMMHEEFDRLSRKDPASRSRSDLISEELFIQIDKKLSASGYEEFKIFADKAIAHAGDAYSRSLAEDARSKFTLQRLATCHETIYRVAEFVGGSLLWGTTTGGLAHPQFDHLEKLDAKWCTEPQLSELREHWKQYASEIDNWRGFSADELLS